MEGHGVEWFKPCGYHLSMDGPWSALATIRDEQIHSSCRFTISARAALNHSQNIRGFFTKGPVDQDGIQGSANSATALITRGLSQGGRVLGSTHLRSEFDLAWTPFVFP